MKEDVLKLIGDDGSVYLGREPETEISGDGTKTVQKPGIYIITARAANSFFPAGLNAGEAFPMRGAEVLKAGDKARRIPLEEAADISGWKLEITQEQVDTTLLRDHFKKFRPGKKDANGTMNTIFTLGVTDREGGLADQMMKTVRKRDNAVTVNDVNGRPLYFVGYARKSNTPGETELFVFAQIYLYGISFGGQSSQAQSFDCSFKLTGIDPVFYSVDIPLTA